MDHRTVSNQRRPWTLATPEKIFEGQTLNKIKVLSAGTGAG